MTKWSKKGRKKGKTTSFKPTRPYIEQAVEDYLKKGGKITKLNPERDYESILRINDPSSEADDFLAGK